MPIYQYKGRNDAGVEVNGTVEAPSRSVATVRLRQKGVTWVDELAEAGRAAPGQPAAPAGKPIHWSPLYGLMPVSPGALGNFYDQLGSLYRAGIGMHAVVSDMAARVGSMRLRPILQAIAPNIAQGESLSENLAAYPQVFPAGPVGSVRAGELTGNLDEVAHDLAADYHAEQRVYWLMVFPKLYFAVTLLLAVLVSSFVAIVPSGPGWPESGYLWLHYVIRHVVPRLVLVVAGYLALRMLYYWPCLIGVKDGLACRLPLWSALTVRVGLTRFYRALELGVRAGAEFPQVLHVAALAAGNRVMVRELLEVERQLRAGIPLSEALGACRFVAREDESLLSVATMSGAFDETLPHLAEQTKAKRDQTIRGLRYTAIAVAYVVTSVIVGVVIVRGYVGIMKAGAGIAGGGMEDLLQ